MPYLGLSSCSPSMYSLNGLKISPVNEGNHATTFDISIPSSSSRLPLSSTLPPPQLLEVSNRTRCARDPPSPNRPIAVARAMGAPQAALASTSAAPPALRRRSTRLIDPPRRDDDQDQPPCSETASTSSQPQRRSTSLIGFRQRVSQPPSPPRASTPPPAAEADAPASSPGAVTTPRRSVRLRGVPSVASPSTPRRRRRSPTATPRTSIDAKAEDWGREKAASGAPEEECVLPFLRKGAPRKVCTWLNESLYSVTLCLSTHGEFWPLVVLLRPNWP